MAGYEGIYRTPESRDAILASYEKRAAALPFPVESCDVQTRAGRTHVLLAGPTHGYPVVFLHGAKADAVQIALPMGSLVKAFRCAFVDVPGHPNRSEDRAIAKTGSALGQWLGEVLDGLDFARAAMLGVSGGAFAILQAATAIPERISRAVLLAPAGLAPLGDVPDTSPEKAADLVEAMTTPGSGFPAAAVTRITEMMRFTLTHTREGLGQWPVVPGEDLARFVAPVLVVAGDRDLLFPGELAIERAKAVLPNLEDAILLSGANHINAGYFRGAIAQRVEEFLTGASHVPTGVTELLKAGTQAESTLRRVLPLVYGELRALARRHRLKWRDPLAPGTVSLVHEAYGRLVALSDVRWESRAQFFYLASRAMRSILIDHAKHRQRAKRGGGQRPDTLHDDELPTGGDADELLALDDALTRLSDGDERLGKIVECRVFGGLTIEETAEALGLSPSSVKRGWAVARAWLVDQLGSD